MARTKSIVPHEKQTEGRACCVCRKPLSVYNKTDRCHSHNQQAQTFTVRVDPAEYAEEIESQEEKGEKSGRKKRASVEQGEQEEGFTLDVQRLLDTVCSVFEITREELLSSSREKRIVIPRHIAMLLLRVDGGYSFPQIAQDLQRRDHTTAMHGCSAAREAIDRSSELQQKIARIRSSIRDEAL